MLKSNGQIFILWYLDVQEVESVLIIPGMLLICLECI